MENEFDIIPVIKELIEGYKHLADEIAEVKTTVMDNLINPINDAYEQEQYNTALSDFRCKYGEKLEPFSDKLKALEGDDFDIVQKAFDDFSAREDGMDADTYTDKLVESVSDQLNTIAAAFGVEPEDVKEITVETTDGEEVKAEVEDGEVVATEGEAETETEETPAKEEPKAEITETETEEAPKEEAESDETETEEKESDEDNYKKWENIYKEEVRK